MDCQQEILRIGQGRVTGQSHGLCVDCYAVRIGGIAEQDLTALAPAALDLLPHGAILLDRELRVIGYNRAESELSGLSPHDVLGRRFFVEVAPCMAGAQVGQWCAEHVGDAAPQKREVEWLLRLRGGDRLALLVLQAGQGRVSLHVRCTPPETRRAPPSATSATNPSS